MRRHSVLLRLLVFSVICLSVLRSSGQVLSFTPGIASTIAGDGSSTFSPASYVGPGTSAALNYPRRVAIDSAGNIYWMEKGGFLARVLASGKGAIPALPSVTSPIAGTVYTVAGSGTTTVCTNKTDSVGDGCPASQISMNGGKGPYGIAVDAHGNVYLGDDGDSRIRVVYAGGAVPNIPPSPQVGYVYAVGGTGTAGSGGDGGPALSAQIGSSHGLMTDANGNIFFADSGNQSVRVIYAAGGIPGIGSPVVGSIYTIAGGTKCSAATAACGDGAAAIASQINGPDSVAIDPSGNIYFGDTSDFRLRVIYVAGKIPGITSPTAGFIYTVVGNGTTGSGPDNVQATNSAITAGIGQAFIDASENIWLPDGTANVVRKIDPTGNITTVAGGIALCAAKTDSVGDGCPATLANLQGVSGITGDAAGDIYLADYNNLRIRQLTPTASGLAFSGNVGQAIASQTVAVQNVGSGAMHLSGLSVSGPFAFGTGASSDCTSTTTLAEGAICNIRVTPNDGAAATVTGIITVSSDATNASSGQNVIALSSTRAVGATTTVLSISPTLANVSQPVNLTATVSVPAGVTIAPIANVQFLNGTNSLGEAQLNGNVATFPVSTLSAGTYSLTAKYEGDANFEASTSSAVSLKVSSQPVPQIGLTSSILNPVKGQAISLTVTAQAFSGTNMPQGNVQILEGANIIGQGTLNAGTLSVPNVILPVGANTLVANYVGDGTFVANSSAPLTLQVSAPGLLSLYPGTVLTVAGSHTLGAGSGGNGGAATSAQLKTPLGMAMDASGNLYIADSGNNRVQRVDTSGNISTFAGTGSACSAAPCGDAGAATSAKLNNPTSVRVDAAGNVYIVERGTDAVREVTTDGKIKTVAGQLLSANPAGTVTDNVAATSSQLSGPRALAIDNQGNLYIADTGNARIRRVDAVTGIITTVAGSGSSLGDNGPATSAQLSSPRGVALDAHNNIYIADTTAFRVRRVDAVTGIITTVVGTGAACTAAPCGDGSQATAATLSSPLDVTVNAAGDLFVTDPGFNVVRRVDISGVISTVVGEQATAGGYGADGSAATSISFNYPNSLMIDGSNNLFVSEANGALVRKIEANASALSFGSVNLGETADETVTLENSGNGAINLSAITIPSGFLPQSTGGIDCSSSLTLNPGSACALDVQFAPITSGPDNDSVTITSDAANSVAPAAVSVVGTGVAYSGTTPQTITFAPLADVTYGTQPVMLSASSGSALPVTFNTVTGPAVLSGNTLRITGAGLVSVTAYQFGSNTYAAATPVTHSFTVNPATLTVTANDASRAVGVANPTFTYGIAGYVGTDTSAAVSGTPVLSTTANTSSTSGDYTIQISAGSLAASNYTFSFVNGTLHVTGEQQAITFAALPDVTYGTTPVALGATASSGLGVTYTVSGPAQLNGSMLAVTGVGIVSVTASQAGNGTYAAADAVTRMFNVGAATLTVTANNIGRAINTPNPSFTYSLAGFVNSDPSAVVSGMPSFSTTATESSALGTYPITISQGTLAAANYVFALVNGTLTVTPPPPDYSITSSITSLTISRGTTGHLSLTLTPVSNYQGTVTFTCGTMPAGASCDFEPSTLELDGSGNPVSGTLNVVTTTSASLRTEDHSGIRSASFFALPVLLLSMLLFRKRGLRLALLVFLLGALGTLSGCGAGQTYVPPSVTTVTVTATSGSLTHSTTINLTII